MIYPFFVKSLMMYFVLLNFFCEDVSYTWDFCFSSQGVSLKKFSLTSVRPTYRKKGLQVHRTKVLLEFFSPTSAWPFSSENVLGNAFRKWNFIPKYHFLVFLLCAPAGIWFFLSFFVCHDGSTKILHPIFIWPILYMYVIDGSTKILCSIFIWLILYMYVIEEIME